MKRSEINGIIEKAEIFFDAMNFKLPPWAFWEPKKWKNSYPLTHEIADNLLGWDITDFGLGDYAKQGLLLFTIRNGNLKLDKKPYAEKAMIVDIGQDTPMHFHWHKMEDIINRGGGNLVIELFMSDKDEGLADETVHLKVDGIEKTFPSGGKLVLHPGESVCLPPYVYHKFYAEKAKSLIGEVSMVNDDAADNRFLEPTGRFPTIEEDVPPRHLLVSDYKAYL
jgi:D-lyxose ketol-isomerase